jgi:hypothetical protein
VNPFTRFLLKRTRDRELARLVEGWDALEALVIRVYKAGQADAEDEAEWVRSRADLLRLLPRWQRRLSPHWAGKLGGGEPLQADPFAWLLGFEAASDFVRNRRAMQTLPAAREALNELIIENSAR